MEKYNKKEEVQYIPFNMIIYTDNKETCIEIINIIKETIKILNYIKNDILREVTFYEVKNIEDIKKIYSTSNIVVLKEISSLVKKDINLKNELIHELENEIDENLEKNITIIIAKNRDELNTIFEENKSLKEKLLNFEIIGKDPEIQEVYNEIYKKIEKSISLTEKQQIQLLDYISSTYEKKEMSYPEYRENLVRKIVFTKQIPECEQNKTIEEIFEDLNNLIGLEKVKNVLKDLVNLISLKEKTEDFLKLKNINLHMVFLGNPGTGKTTVARIVSNILYELKYIKQNKLIEVTSKDLVAEYVGQTAVKTMNVINRAIRRGFVYR